MSVVIEVIKIIRLTHPIGAPNSFFRKQEKMGIRVFIAPSLIFVVLSDFGAISAADHRFRGGFVARKVHIGIHNQILGAPTLLIPDYSPDLS